jgi:hypothetical protein
MAVRNEWKVNNLDALAPPAEGSARAITPVNYVTPTKASLKQSVGQNKLSEVFAGLSQVAPNHDNLVLLEARYHRNEQAKQQNTIHQIDYDVEHNRINTALLSLIDELVKA